MMIGVLYLIIKKQHNIGGSIMEFAIVLSILAPPIGFGIFLIFLIVSDIVSKCNDVKREKLLVECVQVTGFEGVERAYELSRANGKSSKFFLKCLELVIEETKKGM